MGQALREIQVVEEGCLICRMKGQNNRQNNRGKWLASSELEALAGVSQAAVHKALSKRHWHGAELVVREEQTGRGRGARTLLVHVGSLPADLRGAWYAQHGIALHEEVDAQTGEVRHVPDEGLRHDAGFEKKYRLALWRRDLIAPLLAEARYSAGRGRVLKELAAKVHHFPDGRRKKVCGQTLYNWANAYEEEGLYGLMRKRRGDLGARRVLVTRAWDKVLAEHVEEARRQAVADEVTQYIRHTRAVAGRGAGLAGGGREDHDAADRAFAGAGRGGVRGAGAGAAGRYGARQEPVRGVQHQPAQGRGGAGAPAGGDQGQG